MRILQINSVCGRGSTGRIAVDIAKQVRAAGGECTIAWGRGDAIGYDDVLKIGSDLDQHYHAIQTRLLDNHGFASRTATGRFISEIKNRKYDLIHLHNIHGYYLNTELLFEYLKHADIPVVWTLHDCWSFTGHCTYFSFAKCDRWMTECHHCPQKTTYPASHGLDASRSNYHRKHAAFTGVRDLSLTSPSRWLAELVKQSYLSEYPVEVVRNEIDRSLFRYTPSNVRSKYGIGSNYLILFVANVWDRRKGLEYAIALNSHLREDETVAVVGVTPDQAKLLPAGYVAINRTSSAQELVELYSASDIFINPTLEDNAPTTNYEAVACGLPVVCFDTGGAPETLEGSVHYLTRERTVEEIRYGIDALRKSGENNLKQDALQSSIPYEGYLNLYRRKLELSQ